MKIFGHLHIGKNNKQETTYWRIHAMAPSENRTSISISMCARVFSSSFDSPSRPFCGSAHDTMVLDVTADDRENMNKCHKDG